MDDTALVGIHRLKHNASLVFEHTCGALARQLAESLLSLFAISRNVKRDLDVFALLGALAVLADLAAVGSKSRKILERVQRLAVVSDKNSGISAGDLNDKRSVIAGPRADLGVDAHVRNNCLDKLNGVLLAPGEQMTVL
mgnify:CR=1 FL=1